MRKKKTNNKATVLKLIRQLRNFSLKKLQEKIGIHANLANRYENEVLTPSKETVIRLADGLDVKPDVLLYAFGYLPENEMNIIKEDPYYYMDKIQKMCKNHAARYAEENTNIDDLNIARTYDYIIKSMENQKNENKGNT